MMTTSVVIAVRNGADRISDALNSVLPQLTDSDEVIVVDDASTDHTIATVANYSPRIRIMTGHGNGPAMARNIGLAAARGKYVAFLDHDDLWPEGRQAALLAALGPAPDAMTAVQGRTLVVIEAGAQSEPYGAMHGAYLAWQTMSMLCPTALVRGIGGFAEDMRYGEDIDLGLRLLEAGMRVHRVDAASWIYRRHALNVTNDVAAIQAGQAEALRRKIKRTRMKR